MVLANSALDFAGARRSAMLEHDDDRIVVTASEARAGASGHNVRSVLVVSLIGAILVMIVIAAFSFR